MNSNEQSPLGHLAAFALSFAAGTLTDICAKACAEHATYTNSSEPNVS